MATKYNLDRKARNNRRYRYSHIFGLVGQSRVVDILVGPTQRDHMRKFDNRTSTTSITPHPMNIQQRTFTSAPSMFLVPHMPTYPMIDHRYQVNHLGYPIPLILPDHRLGLVMNISF